ncbi:MAG: hypothetical protein KKB21_04860 [Nanoarchaeota archaeon]|nr:hypothetical protein [Nanoarchaeota archaeon]MBU4086877.1 hypothetical protein [Nanoarchaeota archaeon]
MRYNFFRAQKPVWELAACWQSILKFRGFMEPSQEEIAEMLRIGRDGFSKINLHNIAKRTGAVSVNHINPFLIHGEAEDILDAVKGDVDAIVAYDGRKLTGIKREPAASFALWGSYNQRTDKVSLQTPNSRDNLIVSLGMDGNRSGLMDCMQAREDERYGLYIINAWK